MQTYMEDKCTKFHQIAVVVSTCIVGSTSLTTVHCSVAVSPLYTVVFIGCGDVMRGLDNLATNNNNNNNNNSYNINNKVN